MGKTRHSVEPFTAATFRHTVSHHSYASHHSFFQWENIIIELKTFFSAIESYINYSNHILWSKNQRYSNEGRGKSGTHTVARRRKKSQK